MNMKKLSSITLLASMAISATPALAASNGEGPGASNFSYSTLGFQIGKVTLEDEIVFLGEVYEEFSSFGLTGTFQAADNFAIGLSGSSFSNDGPRTEITNTTVSVNAYFPLPVGDRIDIIPQIAYISSEAEACADGFCSKADDSGIGYGLSGRAWVVPGQFEINGGFSDSNAEDSESVLSLGAAAWFNDHHSVGFNFDTSENFNAFDIGYTYTW